MKENNPGGQQFFSRYRIVLVIKIPDKNNFFTRVSNGQSTAEFVPDKVRDTKC